LGGPTRFVHDARVPSCRLLRLRRPISRRLFGGLLGLALARAQAADTPCRVVGSADPPFRSFHEGQAGGLYFELLRAAAAEAGWPLSFIEAPSARALRMMQDGDADLMMGPLRRPEREAYLHYSRVTLPAEDKAVYTRPQHPPLRHLEALRGLQVGVQRGKRYGGGFDELEGVQRVELRDYDSALQMLALGRLDAVVAPQRQARWVIARLGLDLREQALAWPGETPYLVLARASPWRARVAEIEHGFDVLRRKGEWARILARY
jgi:polar amino acid transport system substrate-binding protein